MTLTKFLRTGAAALGALAVASVTQANAADIYTGGMKEAPVYIPPPVWTGFYIGGHLGAAWESFSFQRHEFEDGLGCCLGSAYTYNPAFLGGNNQSQADAFGGVQFGYNFQYTPAWVFGLEVDLGGMSLNGHSHSHDQTWATNSSGTVYGITPVNFDGESQGGFYGDITGRLGYTWGPAMLYVKGGFAWLDSSLNSRESFYDYGQWGVDSKGNPINPCGAQGWCNFSHNANNTLTGYTIGAGLEWKVSPAWSIKVEYLHFDFTNFNNNCCNDFAAWGWSNNFNNHSDLQVDTVKLGFNYFWSPAPPAPLK